MTSNNYNGNDLNAIYKDGPMNNKNVDLEALIDDIVNKDDFKE